MNYTKIDRLNEGHENVLPEELLNMSVKDLLDKVGELDTQGDAEYEIIEDALIALKDKILSGGFEAEEINFTPDSGVEVDEEPMEFDAEEEVPTFDQISNDMVANSDKSQLDNFEF